jgi:uncharacterized protein YjbI with pentapeptide repeats
MSFGKGPLVHEWPRGFVIWITCVVLISAVLALILGVVTLGAPELRPGMKVWTEIVRNVGVGVFGAFGGSFALYIAYLRSVAAKDQADAALLASKTAQEKEDRERELDRKAQVASDLTKAVEHLGHAHLSIRIAAIYALEALADVNEDMNRRIVATLAARARELAPLLHLGTSYSSIEAGREAVSREKSAKDEIQLSVNTILRCLDKRQIKDQIDLRGVTLEEITFKNIDFSFWRLDQTRLKNCEFLDCRFVNTNTGNVNLYRCRFDLAVFEGSSLYSWILNYVSFNGCKFNGCNLSGWETSNFTVTMTDFNGGTLKEIKSISPRIGTGDLYYECNFHGVLIDGMSIPKANFKSVSFLDSRMASVTIANATFSGGDLLLSYADDVKFIECEFDSEIKFHAHAIDEVRLGNTAFDHCRFRQGNRPPGLN